MQTFILKTNNVFTSVAYRTDVCFPRTPFSFVKCSVEILGCENWDLDMTGRDEKQIEEGNGEAHGKRGEYREPTEPVCDSGGEEEGQSMHF